jgi:undecaprenyl-diphosphatase
MSRIGGLSRDRVERTGDSPELVDVTVRWSDVGLFLVCYVVLVVVWVGIGEAITHSAWITGRDQSVAEWFVATRTTGRDTLSEFGSNLAATMVKVAVTAALAVGMKLVWKRWREPLMMVIPLALEASVFITVTYIVARPRPDVQRLESSPVDSSFPSGHVAAAAAYAALVVIVYWHSRRRAARAAVVVLSVAVAVIVAWARMYRGMHHLTDVVAGASLGVMSVGLTWLLVDRAIRRTERAAAVPATATTPPQRSTSDVRF